MITQRQARVRIRDHKPFQASNLTGYWRRMWHYPRAEMYVVVSYDTPIAAYVPALNAVFITQSTYSVTTSGKHMPTLVRLRVETGREYGFSYRGERSTSAWTSLDDRVSAMMKRHNVKGEN